MPMKSAFDFHDTLLGCHTAEDVELAWQNWICGNGFARAGTLMLGHQDSQMKLKRISTNYPDIDENHYINEGFYRFAPSSNPLRKTSRLYSDHFSSFSKETSGRARRFGEFVDFVENLKMPGEATIRFASGSSDWVSFHIWGEENERQFNSALRSMEKEIVVAASFASISFHGLNYQQIGSENVSLSGREAECLLWLSKGEKQHEIADRMGLDIKTIEMHLRNARQKLSARSTPQAVAIAIVNRIISP